MKGLNLITGYSASSQPSEVKPKLNLGLDFNNEQAKVKLQTAVVGDFVSEAVLSYKPLPRLLLGANLVFEPKKDQHQLSKYDFGINVEPADKSFIGLKHETITRKKDAQNLGKFLLYFYHAASPLNTVGTEFSLDWETKQMGARLGATHKFSDDVSGKVKLNNEGRVDGTLKYKISEAVTATATSGLTIKNVTDAKSGPLPLGIQLDLKF